MRNYKKIFEHIYTADVRNQFLSCLEELEGYLFNAKISIQNKAQEILPHFLLRAFLETLADEKIEIADPLAVAHFVTGLKKELVNMPIVHLSLAFDPKEALLKKISDWFEIEFGKKVLLEISVEKSIVAGIIIEENGIHRDYSLKKILQYKYRDKNFLSVLSGDHARF